MATVKGDVHDIGKNIVGVVLQCNNFEVIDLGVMVPAEKILEVAKDEQVDIIGLSGLITPSLDEMVHVASEMQRLDYHVPLLIGGATTSKAHTAVKIEPKLSNSSTVYVPDASRSVGVATSLMSPDLRDEFVEQRRSEYQTVRDRHAGRDQASKLVSYSDACTNSLQIDWSSYQAPAPEFTGVKVFENFPLDKLVDYIDWTPFFLTWELVGKYPAILDNPTVGAQAQELFDDAQRMLKKIIEDASLTANGVIGFWPANRSGSDDIELYTDESRSEALTTLNHLRQQKLPNDSKPNYSLADFVAPKDSGIADYIGGFAVTTGIGDQALVDRYDSKHDDYSSIMVKALADRLAEAFAEYMHEQVRQTHWGYAADESLSNEELIREAYRGIRPAPGYPACPDHSEKAKLFELLDAPANANIELSDSFAMMPAASVSGWYFAHPEARYFGVGKINKDQVESLAARKGWSIEEAERWLSPNLVYDR